MSKWKSFTLALFLIESQAMAAGWGLNIGYQNPRSSHYGLNFLYQGAQWGTEIGIGYASLSQKGSKETNKSNVSSVLGGEVDVRYEFGQSKLRPYLMAGFASAIAVSVGNQSGGGLSLGGPFLGLGIRVDLGTPYLYLAGSAGTHNDTQAQGGLGFFF